MGETVVMNIKACKPPLLQVMIDKNKEKKVLGINRVKRLGGKSHGCSLKYKKFHDYSLRYFSAQPQLVYFPRLIIPACI